VIDFASGLAVDGTSANYLRQILAVLSALFNDAIDDERATSNPTLGVARRFAKQAAHGVPVAAHHLPALLAAIRGHHLEPLWRFQLQTGVRLGEALALRHAAIDLAGARAHIRETWLDGVAGPVKSGEARWIHLFPETVALLAAIPRCEPSPHVFVNPATGR